MPTGEIARRKKLRLPWPKEIREKYCPPLPRSVRLPDYQGASLECGIHWASAGAFITLDALVAAGVPLFVQDWWARYAGPAFYFSPNNARCLGRKGRLLMPYSAHLAAALLRSDRQQSFAKRLEPLRRVEEAIIEARYRAEDDIRASIDAIEDTYGELAFGANGGRYDVREKVLGVLYGYVDEMKRYTECEKLALVASLVHDQLCSFAAAERKAMYSLGTRTTLRTPSLDYEFGPLGTSPGRAWTQGWLGPRDE